MSFIADIREVSESVLSQLADRFGDLPRPLLAAIGAGDFAVERLAELREALGASLEKSAQTSGDVRDFAVDLPGKVQEAANEVIESVQKFAADVPVKTQALVAQLPDKVVDIREALSTEQLKGAVDGYTQLAGVIYGSLADRGDKTWSKVVATAGHDAKIVDTPAKSAARTATKAIRTVADEAAKVAPRADVKAGAAKASSVHAENLAAASADRVTSEAKPVVTPTATKPAVVKPAGRSTSKPAARKPAAPRPAATTTRRPAVKPAPAPTPAAGGGSGSPEAGG